MAVVGFDHFAHLRIREHRPGVGSYELPPVFGPGSTSSARTIFARHARQTHAEDVSRVGPGAYDLPNVMGSNGRGVRLAPHASEANSRDLPARAVSADTGAKQLMRSQQQTPRAAAAAAEEEDSAVRPLPPQYSLALTPDSPAFSFYGKLATDWGKSTTGAIGPGEYNLLPTSNKGDNEGTATRTTSPGVHIADRHPSPTRATTPGPGAYDVKRFADTITTAAAQRTNSPGVAALTTPHRSRHTHKSVTPGPGAYDDPTSISHRLGRTTRAMGGSATFGIRRDTTPRRLGLSPGPGSYNVESAFHALAEGRPRGPRMRRPISQSRSRSQKAKAAAHEAAMVQSLALHLPSDFDFHYQKGKSMLPRGPSEPPLGCTDAGVGPGSYTTSADAVIALTTYPHRPATRQVGIANKPFNPYTAQAEAAAASRLPPDFARPLTSANAESLMNEVNYEAVMPRARGVVFDTAPLDRDDVHPGKEEVHVPGPGHYRVNCSEVDHGPHGTVFYKGECTVRTRYPRTPGAGPGAYCNEEAAFSNTIQATARSGSAGKTFGVRYPARATHQVCKPYDETTNTNCVYPDEKYAETTTPRQTASHTNTSPTRVM